MKGWVLWIFAVAVVSASPAHADYKIILSSPGVLPGETLRVEVEDVLPDQHLRAYYRGQSFPLYTVGPNAQRALIGIALGSPPGVYPLQIRDSSKAKSPIGTSVSVEIASRTYTIEDVALSSEKNKLTKWEHQEVTKIRGAARISSHEQYWEGVFVPPVTGVTIAEFGLKRVHNGTIDAGFHNGVDLRAPQGTPVTAANDGVVLIAYPFKAHGKTVLINHGQGVMSIYLHMSVIGVRPGQKVKKGQMLGRVGSTGVSTAPHVHWQIFVHGVPVNPQPWLETEF